MSQPLETTPAVPGDTASWHGLNAEQYDTKRFTTAEGRFIERYEEDLILDILAKRNVRRILDVPAGTGRLSIPLAAEYDVVGADISADMLHHAKTKADKAGLRIRWEQCNVADLPFDDGSFDAVVTARLFQHIPTEMAPDVIGELLRVLKPGGTLIVQFRSGFYGFLINIIRYSLFKRVSVRNRCLFPDQLRRFFRSRKISEKHGYKFPASGRFARLVGYRCVSRVNRFLSRIQFIRWLGAYFTVVVENTVP